MSLPFLSSSTSPISSPTFSLYPYSSLYLHHQIPHAATTLKLLTFGGGKNLKLAFMGKRSRGFLWVSSASKCRSDKRGDFGKSEDDEEETDGDTEEEEEEEELKEISGSSSSLPERWDVLGLGQAMVIFISSFCFLFSVSFLRKI